MSKAVISFRVTEAELAILDRLAAAHDRSRSWVVNHLLREAADRELKLLAEIDEGIGAIEAGDFCEHDELRDRVEAQRALRRHAA